MRILDARVSPEDLAYSFAVIELVGVSSDRQLRHKLGEVQWLKWPSPEALGGFSRLGAS